MTRRFTAALSLMLSLVLAVPAGAQIGTPGNAPLTPGGPRQGLGPPSLSDSVPDIRLRSSGGGIPGAGPPIGYGGAQPRGNTGMGAGYGFVDRRVARATGRRCQTSTRICVLKSAAPVRSGCSCRLSNGKRARGHVVP
ncbi:hypothetical protein FG93_00442 [Bosea sp. LC85]|nr:hypothetical protein FG93_00442 [Bosea sp. LC85]